MNPYGYGHGQGYGYFLHRCGCGRGARFGVTTGQLARVQYEILGAQIETLRAKMAAAFALGQIPQNQILEFNGWVTGWGPFFAANYPADDLIVDDGVVDKLAPWHSELASWQFVYDGRSGGMGPKPPPAKPPPTAPPKAPPTPGQPSAPVSPAKVVAAGGAGVAILILGAVAIGVLASKAR